MSKEIIITGKWDLKALDTLIYKSWMMQEPDKQIAFLSGHFLEVQYKDHTLIGSVGTQELFVINLETVDCFTFIEYIEAMRLSNSFATFKDRLKRIRYQGGVVDYYRRNHFFTDWLEFNSEFVADITNKASGSKSVVKKKLLNLKEDGSYLLPGIEPRLREIRYIPSFLIDNAVLMRLNTGDYIGMYSNKTELDVSHVGILIKKPNKVVFIHASSEYKRVIEQDFKQYIDDKPGIVVLRPLGISVMHPLK